MNEDKKPNNPTFIPEKNGDTEKYKTINVGVRENHETTNSEQLREEMRKKVGMTSENPVIDLASALNDHKYKAVRYGVLGTGHGGSRLAEQFYQFGYKACAINTSEQDLYYINLPKSNKLLIGSTFGGAGKSLDVGEESARESEQDIKDLLEKTFGKNLEDVDSIVLCSSSGGGSGAGSIIPLVEYLSEYGLPISVLFILPMQSEGTITNSNAITSLDKLAKLSTHKLISSLVIIDNSKIENLYTNISIADFYKVANFDITNIFNTFNTLSSLPSQYNALDPTDYIRILTSGSCTIYGKIEIPLFFENGRVEMSEDDIVDLLLQNLQDGLLAEGFDVSEAIRAGVYITGKDEILSQIPASTFNYVFASLNDEFKKADLFKGIYSDERLKDKLIIYTLISGVGLPRERVEMLKLQAEQDVEEMEEKEQNVRKRMEVFQQTISREEDKYQKRKKENTTFGRMVKRRRSRN